jgi:CxC6 like cysteine cluster associated with KDZ transposases
VCIYNDTARLLPWSTTLPQDWPISLQLDYETVGDSFIISSLINWHCDHETVLQVPHKASSQTQRWQVAINSRNFAMAGPGQPTWNHACDLCTKHTRAVDGWYVGAIRSVVTDGVSLGHPCCGVHDCTLPLVSNRDRYCAKHQNLHNKCAVVACHEEAEPLFRTCRIAQHRSCEDRYLEHSKAMFQLKNHLARQSKGSKKLPEEVDSDGQSDDSDVEMCDPMPAKGNQKVFARFG